MSHATLAVGEQVLRYSTDAAASSYQTSGGFANVTQYGLSYLNRVALRSFGNSLQHIMLIDQLFRVFFSASTHLSEAILSASSETITTKPPQTPPLFYITLTLQ